jgi:hypothetical protein
MADSDRTPFEIIRTTTKGGPGRFAAPAWWRGRNERRASDALDDSPRPTGRAWTWLGTPLTIQCNRAALLAAIAVLGTLVVVAYEVGTRNTRAVAESTDDRSTRRLADYRAQQVNPHLVQTTGETQNRASAPPTDRRQAGSAAPVDGDAPEAGGPGATRSAQADQPGPDSRQVGLNYYCLATMPRRYRAEADQMIAFLQSNRVDAFVNPVDNRLIQVIVLRGFERISSPQARRFRDKLEVLGRAWKSRHGGYTDWHDMYAIKHRAG